MSSLPVTPPTHQISPDHRDPAPLARVLTRRRVIAAVAGVVGMAGFSRFPRATAAPVVKRVAALDATAAEKTAADFRCDGTDDYVEVNAALTALPLATGGI